MPGQLFGPTLQLLLSTRSTLTASQRAMDVDAYAWACGSSIRALAGEEAVGAPAQGLLSLWATAVHVAAAQGDADLEDLGAAKEILVGEPLLSESEAEAEAVEASVEASEAVEAPTAREVLKELPGSEQVSEQVEKDAGFLALLSCWSDEAPGSRLLEEARRAPCISKARVKPQLALERPQKGLLKELRERFPRTKSPPVESKRWQKLDLLLYFGP